MRILHITDFHYRSNKSSKSIQSKLVRSLCDDLSNKDPINVVLFTGDLVHSGKDPNDFHYAFSEFLKPVANTINLDTGSIFMCAGNHDVYRGQELPMVQNYFETKLDSNDSVNSFVENQDTPEFLESVKNMTNYFEFLKDFHSNNIINRGDLVTHLLTVHKRKIDGLPLGIVTVNSAWRSNSDEDRGNLIIPTSIIIQGLKEISECKFKILLVHNSFDYLRAFNQYEVEDEVFQGFHIMFSGHIHRKRQSIYVTPDVGIICCSSPATLNIANGQSKIGYTILNVHTDSYEVEIESYIYDRQDNFYHRSPIIKAMIPLQKEKAIQNKFRKTLRKRYERELIKANELFVSTYQYDEEKNFLDLFTVPILKSKSRAEIQDEDTDIRQYSMDYLYTREDNLIIFGRDKSGKTSLLKRIQLEFLAKFSTYRKLQYYIDCKEYDSRKLNLYSKLARYYEMSTSAIAEKMKKLHLKLLVDNYNPENRPLVDQLNQFLNDNENCSFIVVTDETIFRTFETLPLGSKNYSKLYIHDITRKEIRYLTNKWPNIPENKIDYVLNKIVQIFSQLHIPYNYWTVSLLLWVFEKTNELNFHSNVELIELYIDSLLEKKRLAIDTRIKIQFENFKVYLGELAYYLIIYHTKDVYSATYAEIVSFTEKYKAENKRFVIDTKELVDRIIDRGIIKKKDNNSYTFRLKGVFEYFLAIQMKNDGEFRNKVINDDTIYLSFGNEIELYSGFVKNDAEFMKKIFLKTKNMYDKLNHEYAKLGSHDENLILKMEKIFDISQHISSIMTEQSKPLTPEKQDELMESFYPLDNQINTEVEPKRIYPTIEKNSENLERFLSILSRVFRNTDLLRDSALMDKIFDYIINSASNLGFLIIDEVNDLEHLEEAEIDSREQDKFIFNLLANFIPLIVQVFLFDAMSHHNLERIIKEKIESLRVYPGKNQYHLLILSLILADLDLKKHVSYIEQLIEDIDMGILRRTILLKLYFYLIFKTHRRPQLEKDIRKYIQKLTLKIDKKSDLGQLHKKLDEKHKIILLRRKVS